MDKIDSDSSIPTNRLSVAWVLSISANVMLLVVLGAAIFLADNVKHLLERPIDNVGIWQTDIVFQGHYVRATADAYAHDGNVTLAIQRLSYLCQENGDLDAAFYEATARVQSDPNQIAKLEALYALVENNRVQQAYPRVCEMKLLPSRETPFAEVIPTMLIIVLIVGVGLAALALVTQALQKSK